MSHVDAEQALVIYRHFCKQAEYAVEFLGVAKKLQNLLNVPIPSLNLVMFSIVASSILHPHLSRRRQSPLLGPWRSI
jgi:phosphatidylinositol-binding clathrin assembly protein